VRCGEVEPLYFPSCSDICVSWRSREYKATHRTGLRHLQWDTGYEMYVCLWHVRARTCVLMLFDAYAGCARVSRSCAAARILAQRDTDP